ncbi:beta-ketoacyl synthase N-terminal-like domain-containing protein [Streptomyces abikoensis]|uniref:type I polyketide synthase n=1 Tax=Streptomyces abikoensis TaxID=97398 RepID=UPI003F4D4503
MAAVTAEPTKQPPVAIVGMAVTLPGADGLEQYWHNLVTGVDAVSQVPEGRWDQEAYGPDAIYCRRGGFVDDRLAGFDPAAFGIMPGAVPATEPDQLIALHTAAAALADAGGLAATDRTRVGVVLGRGGYLTAGLARLDQRVRTAGQLVRTLRELLPELGEQRLARVRAAFEEALGPDDPGSVIGLVPHFAASRVANRLDLRGPAYTVDAACASSLLAVRQAITELAAGRCDVMLAGGVHHCHDVTLWSVFARLGALSPSQRIRPFHREADGVLIGEGTGVVVLKRLTDAVRAGDRVYAVVSGAGVAGDGRTASLVTPDPDGQVRAVRLAWEAAGVDPRAPGSIGLLEAHGTGTPQGDAAEIATLRRVFGAPEGADAPGAPDAVIGSVKSMIGHTMPAAGAAGLIKAALALHRRTLLPTLHCEDPHPDLLATRFRPAAEARPWEAETRRAGVNAFGFGGINAHVVLEEFRPPPGPARGTAPGPARPRAGAVTTAVTEPEPVLRLAAGTPEELRALLDADDPSLRVPGTGTGGARLVVAGPSAERLALARKLVARGRAWGGRRDVWFAPRPVLGPVGGGRTAFLFPGLEARFTDRGDDLARHFGLPRPHWGTARVGDVAEHGAAVVDSGRLLAAVLRRCGIEAEALAGHSVGEWAAMGVGGIFADGEVEGFLRTFDPGALHVPDLAYVTFGAPAARVAAALAGVPEVVLSHDNAPHQTVVCGPARHVATVTERLRAEGVTGRRLPFASGFHTPMLAPYLGPIRETMERFTLHRATTPVWSGTTCAPFPDDPSAVRDLFVRHLLEPVRFRGLVDALHAAGFRAFVQAGEGQLPALVGDTLGEREHLALTAVHARRGALPQMGRVVAGLWAFGADPDFRALPTGGRTGGRAGVRLALDAGPVSLKPATRDRLRTALSGSLSGSLGGPDRLDAVAGRFPEAGELRELLAETADAATAVFTALEAPRRAVAPAPRPATGPAPGTMPDPASGPVPGPASGPARGPVRAPRAVGGPLLGPGPGPATGPVSGSMLAPASGPVPGPVSGPARGPAQAPRAVGSPAPGPASGPASGPPSGPALGPVLGQASRAASGPPPAGPGVRPEAGTAAARRGPVLRVSLDTMPYLVDHCFFAQRPGWPDLGDRWPVVPATTLVRHMTDAVASAGGGTPVAVRDARFLEWLAAEPPVDVPVTVAPDGRRADRLHVELGRYARADVETAPRHPAPPAAWPVPAGESVPTVSARRMYEERWVFHGPLFRGVTAVTALGDRHVRGVLTAPPAPGALLDNAGQLLGYWLMATRADRTVVLPSGIRDIRFHGPEPAPGTRVDCHIRVTSLTETLLTADLQLGRDGTVWCEIRGWEDRRFDSPAVTEGIRRRPGHSTVAQARDGGWHLVFDHWPDPASRELTVRNLMGGAERRAYAERPPRGRRQWLLGRIAAKDAVRHHLWQRGAGPVFPAEIRVRNDAAGRPHPEGVHGRELPPLALSLAHCEEAAVALVRPAGAAPVGIDIEEIAERPAATRDAVLADDERTLLDRLGGGPRALTRVWAAKEAAAKAEGTGLMGRPRDFRVRLDEDGRTTVRAPSGRVHSVSFAETANPSGLRPRRYVVAWTEDAVRTGDDGADDHPRQHQEENPP